MNIAHKIKGTNSYKRPFRPVLLSTAKISSPVSQYFYVRNPRYTNRGKFLKLSDFLAIVMDRDLSGAMIIIEVMPPPLQI
jgi:hypothetical protein